jgi:hypothetical protein
MILFFKLTREEPFISDWELQPKLKDLVPVRISTRTKNNSFRLVVPVRISTRTKKELVPVGVTDRN